PANTSTTITAQSHTYVEEGSDSITVKVTDPNSGFSSANGSVTVNDQQLTTLADANLAGTGTEGVALSAITGIATFTDPAGVGVESSTGDTTATISWGDTLTSTGTVVSLGGGNYRVDAP